jgi:hypothetical protein
MTHTRVPARAWRALFARSLPVWQLNLLFWGLFGAMAFGLRLFMGVPLWRALVSTVIFEGMCLLLAFALRGIYRRSRRDFGLSSAFRMIFLSFAAAALQGAMTVAVSLWIGWHNPWFALPVDAFLRLLFVWTIFMMWSLGYYWLWADTDRTREQDRRQEAQREAQRMELQMLRAQLDPHFLFNSLNGIAAEIRPHPDIAVEMVGELSDYLRYSLDHRKQPIARLSTELGAMESYLRIERARLKEGEKAHGLYQRLIAEKTTPNLWTLHPPFQIDANFGAMGGVVEMLIQSHEEYIELLPALPKAWQDGSYKGLVARGNFVVDVAWSAGRAKQITVNSRNGGECRIAYRDAGKTNVTDAVGATVVVTKESGDRIRFNTTKGGRYTLLPR